MIPNPMGWSDYTREALSADLLISELQDVDGNVIYRVQPEAKEVVDIETAERHPIFFETLYCMVPAGVQAIVLANGKTIPVGGKTGTTNEYRNAVFGLRSESRRGQISVLHRLCGW